jgi:ClpP class serine protease
MKKETEASLWLDNVMVRMGLPSISRFTKICCCHYRLRGDPSELFSGRPWTGRQALELGLVDGLGGMTEVLRGEYGDKVCVERALALPLPPPPSPAVDSACWQ